MGYDGAASPASTAARDAKKKKRGNRSSAKLKQCKLDARREQWLSQVKDGKEAKAAASPTGAGSNAGSPILASPHPPLPRRRADARSRGGDPEAAGATGQEVGSSDLDSPMHSPGSDNSSGGGCTQKRCSSNGGGPSLSSGSSLWSSSRSVSEAEDDDTGSGPEEENGVLDDWEAVADALSVDNSHCHQSSGLMAPPEAPNVCSAPANAAKITEPIRSNTRAWTPDDIFRPQSLPGISKQASFPASIGNCWVGMGMSAAQQGILALPLSCPICYEDLDPTDSSFLPCPCGFHLCLFCHKRILEADGRCPGCRKQYNAVPGGGETTAAALRVPPVGAGHDEIRRAAAEAAEAFRPALDQGNAAAEDAAAEPGASSSAAQCVGDPYYEVDDRLDFGMQGYLDMAQGMLIDPPSMAGSSASGCDDDDNDGEVRLWSY